MKHLNNRLHQVRGYLLFAGGLITLAVWMLASPAGSGPDDNFHLASIWCGRGSVAGQCQVMGDTGLQVPSPIVSRISCFAEDQSCSGVCQEVDIQDWSTPEMELSTWNNHIARAYPRGYYAILSHVIFSSDIRVSVLVIRSINIGLAMLLWCLLYQMSRSTAIRQSFLLSTAVVSVPLGLFIIASNNPSSWAIISQSVFWGFLLLLARNAGQSNLPGQRQIVLLWILTVASALVSIAARADASIYVLLVMGLTLLLHTSSLSGLVRLLISSRWLSSAVMVIAMAALYTFFFKSAGPRIVSAGLEPPTLENGPPEAILFYNAIRIPMLWHGAFGGWGLGRLETEIPTIVPALIFSIAFFLMLVGINERWHTKRLVVGVLMLAVYTIPLYVLMKGHFLVGEKVQPRYLLPLFYPALGFALLGRKYPLSPFYAQWSITVRFFVAFVLSVAHSIALHTTMRRYISGSVSTAFNLNESMEWWWQFAPMPMTIWMLGTLGFTAVVFVVMSVPASVLTAAENVATSQTQR